MFDVSFGQEGSNPINAPVKQVIGEAGRQAPMQRMSQAGRGYIPGDVLRTMGVTARISQKKPVMRARAGTSFAPRSAPTPTAGPFADGLGLGSYQVSFGAEDHAVVSAGGGDAPTYTGSSGRPPAATRDAGRITQIGDQVAQMTPAAIQQTLQTTEDMNNAQNQPGGLALDFLNRGGRADTDENGTVTATANDEEEGEEVTWTEEDENLPTTYTAPKKGLPWWGWGLIGLGGVGAIVGVVAIVKRRK